MTKSQIKAELRRSACEDTYPAVSLGIEAFRELYWNWRDSLSTRKRYKNTEHARIFFLLVAEAL